MGSNPVLKARGLDIRFAQIGCRRVIKTSAISEPVDLQCGIARVIKFIQIYRRLRVPNRGAIWSDELRVRKYSGGHG